MSAFYEELQDVASEVLAEFKQGTVTLTRPGTSTPGANPWDPPVTTDSVVHTLDTVVKGVDAEFVDGTTILASDKQLTAAVPEITPSMETDALAIDGRTVTILRIDAIPGAGTPVAYRFFARA